MSPADAREPRLVLEVVDGPGGIELPRAGVLTLGSAEGRADVLLEGQGVADVHCAIGRLKGAAGWALKDLGSDYGTLLNGKKVASAKLEAGDQIVLGSRLVRIVDPAAPRSAAPPAAAPERPAEVSRTAMTAASVVQGYRIERPLGRGGMGQVFLAVQESLQRKVALKVLAERFSADADFVRRFQAEARAAAALNHPNIVTVHDVWEEGGRHFLSMEYVDRGTLEARLAKEGPLPPREAVEVLCDAAKGLVYAELRGIVHRDIKPANLMQNEVGTIKIADLGLATHLEAEATEDSGGKIFGTPHFISPEQARGERVDGRSDLYSLGATAYQLLSGETPFEGSTTRDILRGHFFESPRPLEELVPGIPADLAALVAKLLQKKPEDRYASAGALLQDLERLKSRLLHGIETAPAEPAAARKPWALLVIVILLLGGATLVWSLMGGGEPGGDDVQAADPGGAPEIPDTGSRAPDPNVGEGPTEGAPVTPPSDDDSALERLEREAQLAYEDLSGSLDDSARREELLALADTYAGTAWSSRLRSEAAELATRISENARAVGESTRLIDTALAAFEAAAALDDPARTLSEALRAMDALEVDPRLSENPDFQRRWLAVWRATFEGAEARGTAALARADALAEMGAFDQLELELQRAHTGLLEEDWPALPEKLAAEGQASLEPLRATRARIAARLAGLAEEQRGYQLARLRADRGALAAGLGGASGLERELRELDYAAATRRLSELEAQLPLEDSRAALAALRGDLQAGRLALRALVSAWASPGWKRKTVRDPRRRGRANREAVGVDERGVLVTEDGQTEVLPWSAFAAHPDDLHQLFFERLERPYSSAELDGVATLVRAAAVLQAIEEGSEILLSEGRHLLTEDEARALLQGFDVAHSWAEQAGQLEEHALETTAATLFAAALRAVSEERWSVAVAALERLLLEHRDTLLVRLLSDGRALPGLDEKSLPPAASAPDSPSEPGPGSGQESDSDARADGDGR